MKSGYVVLEIIQAKFKVQIHFSLQKSIFLRSSCSTDASLNYLLMKKKPFQLVISFSSIGCSISRYVCSMLSITSRCLSQKFYFTSVSYSNQKYKNRWNKKLWFEKTIICELEFQYDHYFYFRQQKLYRTSCTYLTINLKSLSI